MEKIRHAQWRFGGELGARIDRNVEQWLLRMPESNPGILDMMRRRDRHLPYADLVPWAGEFAGKYLISAVQACRMSADPRLKPYVRRFVDALIASQAADGYLGPFPRARRLLGECDLWGHYHCMLGLLMWYDDTGDEAAYRCAIRIADAICRVYGEGKRRPIEAGNPNFNLAVLHGMAELAARTGKREYDAVCARIEEDLQKDGDWLRQGAAGVEYWRLPGSGPRWEALHILQGLVSRYVATGDDRYRKAVLSLWESIRRLDVHPSGAFSTNEQACGTIYGAGPIETCCSVAWMALSVDVLRLTGDPTVADQLELTLWNEALAAQHPSGQWWTYDTPLNGVRAPSYQQISFQYRPGAPELNCCSVNGPRMLGMTSEWAVLRRPEGLDVNFYGPSRFDLPLSDATRVHLAQDTTYPVGGTVRLAVSPTRRSRFTLRLRIPAWSGRTRVAVNGERTAQTPQPGTYLALDRVWRKGDVVDVAFEMSPRVLVGAGPERSGRVAIHVGPLLLAFDAGRNALDTSALAPIDASKLKLTPLRVPQDAGGPGVHRPMGLWRVRTETGQSAALCDFASAGAAGTDYAAWLLASHIGPPATRLGLPEPDATGRPGPILFDWTPTGGAGATYELVVARDPEFRSIVVERTGLSESRATIETGLSTDGLYYWQVRSRNAWGVAANEGGPRRLRVDRGSADTFLAVRADGLMLDCPLNGDAAPLYGKCVAAAGLRPAPDWTGRPGGAVEFGPSSVLRFAIPYFPERDYTAMARACPDGLPSSGQQVISAWRRGMDDPLRIMVAGSEVFARIEAGSFFSTPGAPVEKGRWVHLAAVKQGSALTLYVDGKRAGVATVPEAVHSQSREIGIGFNPHFSGGEHFVGKIARVRFYARALSEAEIVAAAAGE